MTTGNLEIWEDLITNVIGLSFCDEKTSFGTNVNILVYIGRIGSDKEYTEINLYYNRDDRKVVSAFMSGQGRFPIMNTTDFEKTYQDFFIKSVRDLKLNTILES